MRGASERPASASSSARTTRRRSFGCTARRSRRVAVGQDRVSRLSADAVVQALPSLAGTGRRSRRQLELGQRGAQVEARPADDDRRAAGGERVVDRRVREELVLADRGLVLELPDRDEPGRGRRLVRQDRQAAVDLGRVGRR